MNTSELKKALFTQISKIEDETFLAALKTILDNRNEHSSVYLEEYNKDLLIAEEEIEKGNSYSHTQVKSKIEEWKKK